ncbi:MAG: porin, partial [Zoogloea sp.]|nr:porin [Zoogloea sp.]
MKKTLIAQSVAIVCLAAASSAQAVSFTQGDTTLDINGTINGFYVNRESKTTNAAGVTTAKSSNSELTNGLLPGWINFVATSKVGDQDIKAHFSFAPGINNNSTVVGLPIGNNAGGAGTTNPYSQIDTRNVYFQFGNNDWGTLKFGRDIGLFGQNIILSDMTLLGVGGTSNAGIPYNTTFGMIGHGYMYTGFQPQITYTTPNLSGFQASAGLFQPSDFIDS